MHQTLIEIARALRATFVGSTAGAYLPATDDNAAWRRHAAAVALLGVVAAVLDRLFLEAGPWRATSVAVGALFIAWTLGGQRSRVALAKRWQIEPRRLLLCAELGATLAEARPSLEIALHDGLRVGLEPATWLATIVVVLAFLWALGRVGADHSLQFDVPHRAPRNDGPGPSPGAPNNHHD